MQGILDDPVKIEMVCRGNQRSKAIKPLVEFPGNFKEKENYKFSNRKYTLKSQNKKNQIPLFRQLSFGVLNPLACIVVLTLIRIIITSSRILVNSFTVSMLLKKMEDKVKRGKAALQVTYY